MAYLSTLRLPRTKQITPRSSSPVLPTPTPMDIQQEQHLSKTRKRTAAAILAAEASALPQPISSKRLRKAAGSYRELAGQGTCL